MNTNILKISFPKKRSMIYTIIEKNQFQSLDYFEITEEDGTKVFVPIDQRNSEFQKIKTEEEKKPVEERIYQF